jgi:hypothetical protein
MPHRPLSIKPKPSVNATSSFAPLSFVVAFAAILVLRICKITLRCSAIISPCSKVFGEHSSGTLVGVGFCVCQCLMKAVKHLRMHQCNTLGLEILSRKCPHIGVTAFYDSVLTIAAAPSFLSHTLTYPRNLSFIASHTIPIAIPTSSPL